MEQEDPELTSSHLHSTTAPFKSNHLGEQPEDEQGKKNPHLKIQRRNDRDFQWLRFCASNAGGVGSIPGQGTGSMPYGMAKS